MSHGETFSDEDRSLWEKVESEFRKSFMNPEVIYDDWVEIESTLGTHYVAGERYEGQGDDAVRIFNQFAIYTPITTAGQVCSARNMQGYGARLSAPGYLDSTEWAVFSTAQEAIEHLLESFGEGD